MWTSEGGEADSSTALAPYVHVRVGGMTGVGFDASWKDKLFDRVPDDISDGHLVADTCVLNHVTKVVNHRDKDFSSVKKPSLPRHTGPPPTLRNATLTDTSVDNMQNLYPGGVALILCSTEETILESVVCKLLASPLAAVVVLPTERIA